MKLKAFINQVSGGLRERAVAAGANNMKACINVVSRGSEKTSCRGANNTKAFYQDNKVSRGLEKRDAAGQITLKSLYQESFSRAEKTSCGGANNIKAFVIKFHGGRQKRAAAAGGK